MLERTSLYEIADPTEIEAGTTDVDAELYKLAYNIKALVELKRTAGSEAVRLEAEYNRLTREKVKELTAESLKKISVTKSDKFKYIGLLLIDEKRELEEMKNTARYFGDLYKTYVEWINVYKKTRDIPGNP